MNGLVAGTTAIPWFDTGNPGVAEFQAVMKRYAPGVDLSGNVTNGWISAKLLELAAQRLPDSPNPNGILAGVWSIHNNELGGMTQPLTFVQGQDAPQVFCYWLFQIKNGTWISPNRSPRICQ